jgi:hypothetical protein
VRKPRWRALSTNLHAPFAQRVPGAFAELAMTMESDVAEPVWWDTNDTTGQLRFPAGPVAMALAEWR